MCRTHDVEQVGDSPFKVNGVCCCYYLPFIVSISFIRSSNNNNNNLKTSITAHFDSWNQSELDEKVDEYYKDCL